MPNLNLFLNRQSLHERSRSSQITSTQRKARGEGNVLLTTKVAEHVSYCFVPFCPVFCSKLTTVLSLSLILTSQCHLLPMSHLSCIALPPVSSCAVSSSLPSHRIPTCPILPHPNPPCPGTVTYPCSPLQVGSILSTPTPTPAKNAGSDRLQFQLISTNYASKEICGWTPL